MQTDIPFNATVKDGRRTVGLAVDKTNWANTVDEPPFETLVNDLLEKCVFLFGQHAITSTTSPAKTR